MVRGAVSLAMRGRSLATLILVAMLAGCTAGEPGQDDPGAGPEPADPLPAFVWRGHRDAPDPRTEVAAAPQGPRIWVIGGFDAAGVATTTVQVYDTDNDRWTYAPDYPIPIHHTTSLNVAGRIHVFGGYTTSAFVPTSLAFWFDDRTGTWNASAPLPMPRGAHAAALIDGTVYLVGGIGLDGQAMTTTHAYDPSTNTWSTRAPMPTPREHLTAAAVNGTLLAVGGRQGLLSTNIATLEAYDPAKDTWETRAEMPTPRGGIASTVLRDRLVVIGGEGPDGTFPQVEVYDPDDDTWSPLEENPWPRHGLGAVSARGRLYAMLGGPEPGLTASGTVTSLGPA